MEHQKVVVTDFNMPFGRMIAFMFKWALASIPVFLVFLALGLGFGFWVSRTYVEPMQARADSANAASSASASAARERFEENWRRYMRGDSLLK